MPPKLSRALLRGRSCDHWFYSNDCLILRHPRGRDQSEVPVAHLIDDDLMFEHYERLAGKDWVSRAAIDELRQIAAGARR